MGGNEPISRRAQTLSTMISKLVSFFENSKWAQRYGDPEICDFTFGNPHDLPLEELVGAIKHWSTPKNRYWFAYKRNEPEARRVVAESLRRSHGMPFEPEDVFLTNGATAALTVVLSAIVDPGDEVVFFSPPWFLYESLIADAGGKPVRVRLAPGSFDLDTDSLSRALNERTRAVIINSPHNPTGRIYSRELLKELSGILADTAERNGRPVWVISDEAYRKIVFDEREYPSPAAFHSDSFIVYTYGKALLSPGERIGYIALPPLMEDRRPFRESIPVLQMINGWSFPNAVLQHAIGDLEAIVIDTERLQARRDRLVSALREMGYATNIPEGTFYILVESPLPRDEDFTDILSDYGIFCIPGTVMELPGYFRLSLTASDEMIDRALPGFEAALESVNRKQTGGG